MTENIEETSKRVLYKALTERLQGIVPIEMIDELTADSKIKHIMQRHSELAEYISCEIMKTKPDVINIKKATAAIISESSALKTLGINVIYL